MSRKVVSVAEQVGLLVVVIVVGDVGVRVVGLARCVLAVVEVVIVLLEGLGFVFFGVGFAAA